MTPTDFLDEVAQPNMQIALEHSNDIRAIVNAILTLDAIVGQVHAAGVAQGDVAMTKHKWDDDYRDELAGISRSY